MERDKTESLLQARRKLMEYLHMNKLRNTQERVVLLDSIYSSDQLVTAEGLSHIMLEEYPLRISRATVYNSLGLFESAGLVRKVFLNGQVFYERTDLKSGTIRLICRCCGKVNEIHNDKLRLLIEDMRTVRFTMSGWQLGLFGLCSKCNNALKRKQKRWLNKNKQINK